jgi:predicted DCC family thiol-disulfide oxidoreductase YuxK
MEPILPCRSRLVPDVAVNGNLGAMTERAPVATILYDRDCGFCRWSMAKILHWDRRDALRPVALQDPEADRLLPALDHETRMASWHLVSPNGRVHSGGAAAAPLLRLLPGGRPLASLAAAMPKTTDRLYRFVARHRDQLGRMLGTQACSVDPQGTRTTPLGGRSRMPGGNAGTEHRYPT